MLGSRQGYRADRGAVNVHVLVHPESLVCVPALATFCVCQPKQRKGGDCLWSCPRQVLRGGTVEGSASPVAVRVSDRVRVPCVSVRVSLGRGLSFAAG